METLVDPASLLQFLQASTTTLEPGNTTNTTTTTHKPYILINNSIYSVAQATGISFMLFAMLLLTFAGFMQCQSGARALAPRRHERGQRTQQMAFPFGWLKEAWRDRTASRRGMATSHGEEFFHRGAGGGDSLTADAEMLVRFCELGFKFSTCFLMVGLVLVPLYANGHGGIEASGLNRYSASNFADEDRGKFWVVVIAAYLMTGLFGYLVHKEWKYFMRMRRAHLMRVARGTHGRAAAQAQYSVIVEDVPQDQRTVAGVRAFFENLFGAHGVRACVPQGATQSIYRVADLDGTARSVGRCFTARRAASGAASRALMNIDAESLVESARADIAQGRPGAGGTSTAFVTFRSVRDRVVAEQLNVSSSGGWVVSGAPEARDVVWRNAATASELVKFRHLVGCAGTVALSVFWSVPVCALMAFASVEHLERWLPGGEESNWHARHPFAYSLASNYMNVIILTLLFCLLPPLLETMATQFEGHKSKSMIQRIVLMRYIVYQLATLYVIVIASSAYDTITQIVAHPVDIFTLFQEQIPTKSVYFTTLILWRIGVSLPLLLLRPGAVTSLWGSEEGDPPKVPCAFGWEAGDISLIVVLMLTYAVVSPVILVACAMYFGLASLVYRWLFANVYTPEFDSGGAFWYDLFDGAMLGLLLGTLTLAAWAYTYMGMSMQFYTMGLLPISVVAHWIFCQRRFGGPSKMMSFEDAIAIDRGSSIVAFFSDDYYLDPVLQNKTEGDRAPLSVSFVNSNLDEVSMDRMSVSLSGAAAFNRAAAEPDVDADSGPRTSLVASAPS